jgi:hypothetical protein
LPLPRNQFSSGLYRLQLERADLVGRNGKTSIALTLTDIASGQIVSTRPMWIASSNARFGDLAEPNRAVLAGLLRLAPRGPGTAADLYHDSGDLIRDGKEP